MVCLIKPQFEAGKDKVGKKGVVRDPAVHREVIEKVVDFADLVGFDILGLSHSPIKGPEGNIEYLVYLKKNDEKEAEGRALEEKEAEELLDQVRAEKRGFSTKDIMQAQIRELVASSHDTLD